MKTVIIGASPDPRRYAYKAAVQLAHKGIEVVPIGIRKGTTGANLPIINDLNEIKNTHTVTLYISPDIQDLYYDYILNVLKPKRIIFNPGTENPLFYRKIREVSYPIQLEVACTLVMLSVGTYFE